MTGARDKELSLSNAQFDKFPNRELQLILGLSGHVTSDLVHRPATFVLGAWRDFHGFRAAVISTSTAISSILQAWARATVVSEVVVTRRFFDLAEREGMTVFTNASDGQVAFLFGQGECVRVSERGPNVTSSITAKTRKQAIKQGAAQYQGQTLAKST